MKNINLYKFLFEDKDVNDKDATEGPVSINPEGGLKARQSKDSIDDQIDALILKYENASIEDEEDDLMESMFKSSLKYLLVEQEEEAAEEEPAEEPAEEETGGATTEDPAGSEDPKASAADAEEEIPNLNIDRFTKRCVRLISNYNNLLRVEEAIINRIKNFLDEHYGDAYVTDFLNILEVEHGIALEEFDDDTLNAKEPDSPYGLGANPAGAGISGGG